LTSDVTIVKPKPERKEEKSLMDIIQQISLGVVNKLLALDVTEGLSNCISKGKEICFEGMMELFSARLEELDKAIFEDSKLRRGWEVVKKEQSRTLQTECGTLRYKRRYYKNQKRNQRAYLLDHIIGVESYERVEKGLAAKVCTLATEHSYDKSSQIACNGSISRQTVKNKIRQVKEDKLEVPKVREEVKILHIQADEDHVAMQDGRRDSIVKLVTMHESAEARGGRTYLPQRFCIESYNENVDDMWLRVADTISERYGIRDDLKVYIHGDGAEWIKSGLEWITNSKFVLDKYHLNKYLKSASGGNSAYQRALMEYLKKDDHKTLKKYVDALTAQHICTPESAERFLSYIKTNRYGIRIWHDPNEAPGGSCAEGLVSHILSSRLSSRPRGWLDEGLKAVSRLRVYSINGGIIKPEHFPKKQTCIELKKSQIQKVMKKVSSFAPLPTEILKFSKRGRPEYRLYKSFVNGGFPISLNV